MLALHQLQFFFFFLSISNNPTYQKVFSYHHGSKIPPKPALPPLLFPKSGFLQKFISPSRQPARPTQVRFKNFTVSQNSRKSYKCIQLPPNYVNTNSIYPIAWSDVRLAILWDRIDCGDWCRHRSYECSTEQFN